MSVGRSQLLRSQSEGSQVLTTSPFCTNTVFALVYDRFTIGYIEFTKSSVQLSLAGNSNETQAHTPTSEEAWNEQFEAANTTRSPGNVSYEPLLNEHMQLSIGFRELTDQKFTKFELFANIFAQLARIASFPPRDRVESSWKLSTSTFPRSQTVFAPEGSPSVVEYRHAADVFLRAAFRVVQRRVVHGLAIRVKIAEKFIARALIWYPQRTEYQ
ncbi:MAG: hypothetical protein Q9169_003688 [Polycauliona sp. 2 TL-2023]